MVRILQLHSHSMKRGEEGREFMEKGTKERKKERARDRDREGTLALQSRVQLKFWSGQKQAQCLV